MLGKQKRDSVKKTRKPSNLRQEEEKGHQIKKIKSFPLGKTQTLPWVGVLNSWQPPFTHRHTGELLVELSPTDASNENFKKLSVLCCVYSNDSLEEGVRNI